MPFTMLTKRLSCSNCLRYCVLVFLGSFGLFSTTMSQQPNENQSDEGANNTPNNNMSDVIAQAYVPDDTRPVIAGDVLRFQVFEDEENPILIRVNENGYAQFPYVGRQKVEGKTSKDIADQLEKKLEATYYKQATVYMAVEKKNPTRGKIYIIGEVGKQGEYGIPSGGEFTVSKAILAAGGFGKYAKESRVKVIRKLKNDKQKVFEIDVGKIFETGERKEDIKLKPNDYIIVPQSAINF